MAKLTDKTFDCGSKEEFELIVAIAKRAESELTIGVPRMTTIMDLTVVNNTVGLRLKDLLESPKLDFSHDMYGIADNINRQTYELEGCFMPRFAR